MVALLAAAFAVPMEDPSAPPQATDGRARLYYSSRIGDGGGLSFSILLAVELSIDQADHDTISQVAKNAPVRNELCGRMADKIHSLTHSAAGRHFSLLRSTGFDPPGLRGRCVMVTQTPDDMFDLHSVQILFSALRLALNQFAVTNFEAFAKDAAFEWKYMQKVFETEIPERGPQR